MTQGSFQVARQAGERREAPTHSEDHTAPRTHPGGDESETHDSMVVAPQQRLTNTPLNYSRWVGGTPEWARRCTCEL